MSDIFSVSNGMLAGWLREMVVEASVSCSAKSDVSEKAMMPASAVSIAVTVIVALAVFFFTVFVFVCAFVAGTVVFVESCAALSSPVPRSKPAVRAAAMKENLFIT